MQVAAGIATGDELVLCEMIFGGAFNAMTIEQITATCSCFVWREKSEAGPKVCGVKRVRSEGVWAWERVCAYVHEHAALFSVASDGCACCFP